MSSQEEFGLQTNVEAHCADPQVVQPIRSVSGAWRDIARDNTHYCFPVLVSRPTGREIYTPTSAFVDATGVWRVYRSEGGNAPLPFAPSHWMPLPAPPSSEEQHSQSEPQASTGNPATDTINLNPLPPDIKEIVERLRDGADRFLKWTYKQPYSGSPVISIPRQPGNIDALLEEAASALLSLAGERDYAWSEMKEAQAYMRVETNLAEQAEVRAAQAIAERDEARRERDHLNDVIIPGLNRQLTEQFVLSGKFAAKYLLAEKQLAEAVGIIRKVWKLSTRQDHEITRLVDVQDCVGSFLAQHQSPQSSKEAQDEQ